MRATAAAMAALALFAGPASPATAPACERAGPVLVVRVHGVQGDKGRLVAVLYGDDPADFLQKGKRLARERVAARPGSVSLCLPVPKHGTYAVVVYHDVNDNRRFDRGWHGLPVEGYGVSNNPRPWLGVPAHADAAFTVGAPRQTLDITLSYP
jgi:uncharacterized protein (DUF2141 family)